MKKLIVVFVIFFSMSLTAQESKKWLIGVGVNFIDNTNSQDDNYLDVSNWSSTMSVSKLSVQYAVNTNFSLASEFTLNKLGSNKIHNSKTIANNLAYFGWDINARYNTASLLKLPSKYTIEPIVGLGLSSTDGNSNQSFNTGLSLGYFFNDTYGVRLQTVGKFASEQNTVGNNMIQHALELVFRL
jgi:hypothetical protein